MMLASLVVAAVIAAPPGFFPAPKLQPAASSVAGKPVKVWCAKNGAIWHAVASPDATGYVPIVGGHEMWLSNLACANLHAWLNGKNPPNSEAVAGSMLTLGHEAEHLRGERDEAMTDCAALRAMPAMVRKFFPLKGRISMHDLMALAWDYHDRYPPGPPGSPPAC